MRRRLAVALASVLACASAAAQWRSGRRANAVADAAPAQITLTDTELALGTVSPEDPPDLPRISRDVTIDSPAPWTLQLLAADLPSPDAAAPFPVDAILWRLRGDRFRPLARGLPITLSTGPPTRPGVTTLQLEFGTRNDWAIPPGRYSGPLSLVLSTPAGPGGKPSALVVNARFTLTVPPAAALHALPAALDSPPVDPAHPGRVSWAPLRVGVKANTSWTVFAEPLDDLAADAAPNRLAADRLAVDTASGERESMKRGAPGAVAAGGATGSTEAVVEIRLSALLSGGEAAGRYRVPLRLRVVPGR